MEEQQDLMKEKQEFFAGALEEDQDELLKELDEMVAEEVGMEINVVGPSHAPIQQQNKQVNVPVQAARAPAQSSQAEEDLLTQMMA